MADLQDSQEFYSEIKAWAVIGGTGFTVTDGVFAGVDTGQEESTSVESDPLDTDPLAGINTYEIHNCTIKYELDMIPQVGVNLVIGRLVDEGQVPAGPDMKPVDVAGKIFDITTSLFMGANLEIWTEIISQDAAPGDDGLPLGVPFRVFQGRVVGVGENTRVTPDGGTITLHITGAGWHADLMGTTTATRIYAKGKSLAAQLRDFTPISKETKHNSLEFTEEANIFKKIKPTTKDFWADLAQVIDLIGLAYKTGAGITINDPAVIAAQRMVTVWNDIDYKIQFRTVLQIADSFKANFKKYVADAFISGKTHTSTIFMAMLGLGKSFGLSFIPFIETALYAPVFPMLGPEAVYKTINLRDYGGSQIQAMTPTRMGGVALVPTIMQSLYSSLSNIDRATKWFVGTYDLKDELAGDDIFGKYFSNTYVEIRRAPRWLDGLQILRRTGPRGRVNEPGAPIGPVQPDPEKDAALKEEAQQYKDLSVVMAKMYLLLDLFSTRAIRIDGRLRLDIAPGSILKLEVPSEVNDPEKTPALFGMVKSVIISISGAFQGSMAATSFDIQHIRTEAENNSDKLTHPVHPMCQTPWTGGPLIAGL